MLDPEILLDKPGRHYAGMRAAAGPDLDRARPGTHVFVGDKRHRRDAIRPMALLTASLQDGRNIFREGDSSRRGTGLSGRDGPRVQAGERAEEHRDPQSVAHDTLPIQDAGERLSHTTPASYS